MKHKKEIIIKSLLLLSIVIFKPNISVAQNRHNITIDLENAFITKLFIEIKKQSNINFMYSNDIISQLPPKNYSFQDASISQILAYGLEGTGLTFEILKNNTIIIKRDNGKNEIKGVIVDYKGNPIPGASVYIKGTLEGTISSIDGTFRFFTQRAGVIKIIVSFVGMRTKELIWDGKPLKILMEDELSNIQEVVITGYQVINKINLTSAVSSIKADEILMPAYSSIDKMLEGRIPGMTVITNSGELGVTPRIRIRGTSTLIGNREPLWVVDGIVVNDPVQISAQDLNDPDYINRVGNAIAGINPQDIDRIDVLKDASATALYGTRAANGVIVVTTKRGRIGKPQIRYNSYLSMKVRPRYTDRNVHLMNSRERVDFSKNLISDHHAYSLSMNLIGYEGLLKQLYDRKLSEDEFNNEVARLETMNTDWFALLTKDVLSQQHTVSLSGGNKKLRYYSSVGLNYNKDVIPENSNRRYTGSINLNSSLSDKLSIALTLNANVNRKKYYRNSVSPIDYAYKTSRAIAAYDDQHNLSYYKKGDQYHNYNFNIFNELNNSGIEQKGQGFVFTGNINYKVFPWLTAKGIISYSASQTDQQGYWGEQTYYNARLRQSEYGTITPSTSLNPIGGELSHSNYLNNSYTSRIQFDINKYLDKNYIHHISANLGFELSSGHYNGYSRIDRGYYPNRGKTFVNNLDIITKYPNYGRWLASSTPTIADNLSNTLSAYFSISYSYNNLITFNTNTRLDGSNKFGSRSNEKLLPIWSMSTAYNLWNHVGKKSNIIDNIALRLSYGYQGNMIEGQSPRLIIRKQALDDVLNEFTAIVNTYPNPDLKWERTNSMNFGVDFSLFQRRLMVGASYYDKMTRDAFLNKTISTVNGLQNYVVNSGSIRNWGYSFDIMATPIKIKNFSWVLSTTISKSFNKMNTAPSVERYELNDFLGGTALVKDKPISTFWSYKFIGLHPDNGGPVFDDFRDRQEKLIGLGKYDVYTKVLTPTGKRDPDLTGSINNTFKYRQFRVGFSLIYSLGSKIRLFRLFNNGINFNPEQNISKELVNRWQKPGDELTTNIPAIVNANTPSGQAYLTHWSVHNKLNIPIIASSAWNMYNYSDLRVVSGDYLKCSNLNIAYDFQQKQIEKLGISQLSLNVSVSNLFTLSSPKLLGQTPVQSGFTKVQLSERPVYSFGINVIF